ncbi:MAG: site-specific integrase [Deltaproteobacteria bacterium]|nr:site-specific integrase [Deltaproteobacteria bacterium]
MTWHKTKYPGVRYREHATRKHGIHPDRYFVIRYKQKGVSKEEGLGWASEKGPDGKALWTAEIAAAKLAELKKAYKAGEGKPTRLSEARQVDQDRREREAAEKVRQEKENLTFGQFFHETYYPAAKRDKKRMSHLTEWGHFKNWIEPAIGAIPLKDIRPLHLERLKKTLMESREIWGANGKKIVQKPKSARTIEYIFATIRGAWNMARKHRLIEEDAPTKAVKKPKVENKRIRYLTTEEAHTLLEELLSQSPAVYRMAAISLYTGLRAGEVFGLKWKNLDRENGLLWIMDGKSGKSRPVYMPEAVHDLFQEMTPDSPEDLIFPGPRGRPFPQVPRIFDRAVKKLGFNKGIEDRRERFTFHGLRHTAASFLIQSGVDLYTVKSILGHSTIALTERYSHLANDALKEAARKMPVLTGDQAKAGKIVKIK